MRRVVVNNVRLPKAALSSSSEAASDLHAKPDSTGSVYFSWGLRSCPARSLR